MQRSGLYQGMHCDEFSISVAFINRSGFVELAETLKELERRGIRGRILTTDYLCFSEPYALDKLASLTNIQLKIYHVKDKNNGFHTKGYLFRENGIYRIIIGSANMTQTALSTNMEWNTQLVSTEQGEMAKSIVQEFERLWKDELSKSYDEFIEDYRKIYNRKKQIERLIREQHKIALQNDIIDYDTYNLKPNKMQEEFIGNIHDLRERGATRALLISATGTGKTYASAFALKNEKPKKALFIVHREIIAKQAIKSYQKVFGNTKKLALLSGSSKEYEADILFATMSMMAKQETLNRYKPGEFEWICIDEVHRAGSDSYQRIMSYFQPKFWLGMTASPERTDGFDIFNLFDHNIAYEIRLQQALKEDMLCPFHYFGITDIEINGEIMNDKTGLRNFSYLISDKRVEYILQQANYYGYTYKDTNFQLYQKYTYEDVCRLLNWKKNMNAQNIGGYFYDSDTKTLPVFINYDKAENAIAYEDRFVTQAHLIALSKHPRKIDSSDADHFFKRTDEDKDNKILLFIRKNKDDKEAKEFYFLGEIYAQGEPIPIKMEKTGDDAFEINYKLDVPVREDIYEYIVSEA